MSLKTVPQLSVATAISSNSDLLAISQSGYLRHVTVNTLMETLVGQMSAATAISAASDLMIIEQSGLARQSPVYAVVHASIIDGAGTSSLIVDSATTISSQTTINVSAASAIITVPAGLDIGRQITIRKINSTESSVVTVQFTSTDTVTAAGLTSLTIYGNGSYWTIEKATNTRWELIAGTDTRTVTAGTYIKSHNGVMQQYGSVTSGALSSTTNTNIGTYGWSFYSDAGTTITFPVAFTIAPAVTGSIESGFPLITGITAASFLYTAVGYSAGVRSGTWSAIGRWRA